MLFIDHFLTPLMLRMACRSKDFQGSHFYN
ncbi:hypothetical protein BN874_20026 [Candidatus Contendobacter odensis Run_B_J11]|uniref:Uncharacterized protein n=1 Tax=Candidatus Contendobacter odensis Run_B_J11 TaxID=1400861 RepID=A0A7U7J415_9GAMM|nr:hypothetical protein BN874_20026 [Candidatus Contendobacter odensis Run_B_J11]